MNEILLGLGGERNVYAGSFKGEVLSTDFITGDALAAATGLTEGISINSDSPWLHFELDEKTLYTPKLPLRTHVSKNHLHDVKIVNDDTFINIHGKTYWVRLIQGARSDTVYSSSIYSGIPSTDEQLWHSEWNRLFYPIIGNPRSNTYGSTSLEGIVFGSWANYTEEALDLKGPGSSTENRKYVHVIGEFPDGASRSLGRGFNSIFSGSRISPSNRIGSYAWRPILELVE